ncbi:TrlF family AAA-like ATPase [Rhodoferax sp. UBA5149]|uniref:TrlF family AAA-like ATPase n=1 Tax=Rhodoferax sp. UBA5149 TaxID=1947379 RepID=UPI0025EDAA1D|nr:AAA family ATPase [Rhodoferax sp. UBA5149]
MIKNNPAGSIWSKWDLHVHTPSSIVHNYPGSPDEAWEHFITDLEKLPPDFKVIGINDYIFVDGYEKVLKAKKEGRLNNIDLILPVVELRLDKFAGVVKKDKDGTFSKSDWNRINLHIIFDQLDPEIIRQQFLSSLIQGYQLIPESDQFKGRWQAVITPDSLTKLGQMIIDAAPDDKKAGYGAPLQEGFNNLCVSLDSVLKALERHDLKDRFLLAVGKTEWDNMKWDDQSIAEKRNVINCVDLVFTASANPAAYDNAKRRLSEARVLDKLLDCSDAHALSNSENKDRVGNCFTWIKADPTFQGLVQAVTEFDQRVFVGDTPEKRLLVAGNRRKYVSSISIKKKSGSPMSDTWFDVDIPLNQDLVAIIGNKGSGKSALADVIALVGDTKNYESFSFLNEKRFRNPRNKLAMQFSGTLRWQDGTDSQKDLHENPALSSVERVKYLPQNYLETLCNELAGSGSTTFDGELRKIIYTHVPDEQRIGFHSLDELLNFKISELELERRQLLDALSKANAEIVSVEYRLSPEFRKMLELQLEAKKGELTALEGAMPIPVGDPHESEIAKQEMATATLQLTQLEMTLNAIRAEEQTARQRKTDAARGGAHMARILQTIRNHQKNHEHLLTELDAMLGEAQSGLKASEIVTLTVNTVEIEQLTARYKIESAAQDMLLSGDGESSLSRRREAGESAIKLIKSQLGEKQRLFLVYREHLAQWEQAKMDLQGSKDKDNSIAGYTAQIAALELLPARRTQARTDRLGIVRLLHEQLGKMVAEYRTLYQPVQGFVKSTAEMEMPLPLDFDVRIAEEGFQDNFLGSINRQARGSFAGVDESNLLVRRLLKETDFMDVESVVCFVNKVDDMLHFDRRIEGQNSTELSITDQLRKGNRPDELYDFLFGFAYLKPQYSLTYDRQEISQLSPGERGLLLLVFYLLVDKDDIPLVIDQPEENLDNQTIYKILVRCIKAAKQRRQVIMVTHNPNLAVVCDAEQIIWASCDKANKRFSYVGGAIESAEVKARVIEILEGTEPAFVNRKRKYGL